MPLINVIPPGLDFSSLKVDLPKDPSQGDRPPPKHASFSHQSNPTSPRDNADSAQTSPEKPAQDNNGVSGLWHHSAPELPLWPSINSLLPTLMLLIICLSVLNQ